MNPAIAVGIGCRKGCGSEAIAALVRRALASLDPASLASLGQSAEGPKLQALGEATPPRTSFVGSTLPFQGRVSGQGISLFSTEDKRGEQGLVEAAAALDLPLILLPRAELLAAAPRCETRSARVEALFGLPSVAEAAALAGAGKNSRLVVKRISEAGASCAVAQPSEIAA